MRIVDRRRWIHPKPLRYGTRSWRRNADERERHTAACRGAPADAVACRGASSGARRCARHPRCRPATGPPGGDLGGQQAKRAQRQHKIFTAFDKAGREARNVGQLLLLGVAGVVVILVVLFAGVNAVTGSHAGARRGQRRDRSRSPSRTGRPRRTFS